MENLILTFFSQYHCFTSVDSEGLKYISNCVFETYGDANARQYSLAVDERVLSDRVRIVDPYQYKIVNPAADYIKHDSNEVGLASVPTTDNPQNGSGTYYRCKVNTTFRGYIMTDDEKSNHLAQWYGDNYIELGDQECVDSAYVHCRKCINVSNPGDVIRVGDVFVTGELCAYVFEEGLRFYWTYGSHYGRVRDIKDGYVYYESGQMNLNPLSFLASEGTSHDSVRSFSLYTKLREVVLPYTGAWSGNYPMYVGSQFDHFWECQPSDARISALSRSLLGTLNISHTRYYNRIYHTNAESGYFLDSSDAEYYWTVQSALYNAMEGSDENPGLNYTTDNSWQNILALVGVAASWSLSGSFEIPTNWEGSWLSYRYILGTGMTDLNDYCAYVSEQVDRFYNPWIYHRGVAYTPDQHRVTVTFAARDATLDGFQRLEKQARAWGFWPSWYQAWDFVPYSFIVDWFIPIGSLLQREERVNYYTDRNFCFTPLFWVTEKWEQNIQGWELSFYVRDACSDYTLEEYAWWEHYSPSNKVKVKRTIDSLALRRSLKRLLTPKPQVMRNEIFGLRNLLDKTPYR